MERVTGARRTRPWLRFGGERLQGGAHRTMATAALITGSGEQLPAVRGELPDGDMGKDRFPQREVLGQGIGTGNCSTGPGDGGGSELCTARER